MKDCIIELKRIFKRFNGLLYYLNEIYYSVINI